MDRQEKRDLDNWITREPEMAPEETCVDTDGHEIKVGTKVRIYGGKDEGVVEFISDADGDVDDEGRSILISPRIRVKFADGDTEEFGTSSSGNMYEITYECHDLDVIQ